MKSTTSHIIQKEILKVLASEVHDLIKKEIGVSNFFIIVNKAHDESKREKMTLVLRFVDKEHFWSLMTLKIVDLNNDRKYILFSFILFLFLQTKSLMIVIFIFCNP